MPYMHINNLYKDQRILMFKECYAMEKIHGTSAWLSYKEGRLSIFAGGSNHEQFVALFNQEELLKVFHEMFDTSMGFTLNKLSCHVYGEAYGGKLQGMSKTYGDKLKFVAFEVKIGDDWLEVPKAEQIVKDLGLEFVHYNRIPTTMEALDAELFADSVQAIRNGSSGHMREGIVLRPIIEVKLNNGERVIAKYKRDEFKETNTPRKVVSPEHLQVLSDARVVATEWVTQERLNHIVGKGMSYVKGTIEDTGAVIKMMTDDIMREAAGEIVDSPEVRREVGKATALLFKAFLREKLHDE